jgi:hypothetical protein
MLSHVKHIAFLIQLVLVGLFVSGRESTKLYSIGNNLPWNQPNTWSLSQNGPACGFIPQSNDSLVISNSVVLNTDFILTGLGNIKVESSGLLRGNGFRLTLQGSSKLFCQGEVQLYNLMITDSSSVSISNSGEISVVMIMQNISDIPLKVDGILTVYGTLDCGSLTHQQSAIIGIGKVSSTDFNGVGTVMSYNPCSSLYGGSILSEINWTGAVSNDWNDPLNWTGNQVPESFSNVALLKSENNPVISGTGHCHNIFLSPNTNLIIMPTSVLQVDGELYVDQAAELLLKNSALEYASLINTGFVTGKVKSEFQVTGNTPVFISTPIADALSGVFVYMYLRSFEEANSTWGNYIIPTDVQMTPMQGYELFSAYSDTRYFEGTPNSGEISQSISSSEDGWNLIGNPYPCYIDWQTNAKSPQGWQRGSIASAIYYPDASGSGNYSIYVPGSDDASLNGGSRYIAPMQGFFVKARQSGVIQVNNQVVAQNISFPGNILHNTALKLRVEGNGFSDETVIRFNTTSTFAFDDDFDAYKMTLNENAPSLFSIIGDGTKMAINTLPDLSSDLTVPIGLTCNTDKEFKLTVFGGANFGFRYPLTLEDKETKTFIDLRVDSTYVFHHTPLSDPNRFVLYFDVVSGISENPSDEPEIIMSNGNIKVTGKENKNCTIDVFGIDGKQILHTSGILSPAMIVPFEGNHGIYLVKVTTNSTSHARKLYVE